MSRMTSRERFMTAMRNQKPDRVPCAPDMSNMIPARRTGRPFWDIYYHENPPLWRAYLDAARHFGIDAWFIYGAPEFTYPAPVERERRIISQTAERWVVADRIVTPAGDLTSEMTYYIADPPTVTVKPIKDLKRDWPKVRYLFQEPIAYDDSVCQLQKRELGETGVFGIGVTTPGFHSWFGLFEGTVQSLSYLYYDEPELIEELRALHERSLLKRAEMVIEMRPDFILTGGSGSITLQSPTLWRRLSLPTLQKITRMARQAGVLTMVHSCGREYDLVKACAEETDLDCVNPLEEPPMGDCNLAQLKREFGHRLSLMGNLHTTNVMLLGTPEEVERAARKAIDDAAAGGGFILSTGDQCGRDTPEANIFKLVEVCETYGRY